MSHLPANLTAERLIGIPAGICSGVTKLIVGHPFDTVKVRMQTAPPGRFSGPWDCFKSTVGKEGLRALYKGATPPLLGWTLMDSTQMFTLTNLRLLIQSTNKPGEKLSVFQHALAGLGAGIVVSFVATPVELLKAKLQVQYGRGAGVAEGGQTVRGPVDCARVLIRNHGPFALYQGLAPCLLFRSFFWALWGSYEIYTTSLKRHYPQMNESMRAFLAGGMAANTFWCLSYPADVVKNRIMAQADPGKGGKWKYTGIVQCARSIYKVDGLKGFYRGFVPCFLRSFPTNGAAILVFETVSGVGRKLLS
ncbi:hypothetical protein HDV05_001510 [Chytridiales sp. JEL 0842]|nr:hypothetical protein HDV05_001510 [Chytridiales sp. JEL 0842]